MKRLVFVDAYRGFALVNMVVYHGFYDWVNLLAMPLAWFSTTAAYIWQQLIVFSFVLISGLVFNYAKRPCRRGMFLCFCGGVLTVGTYFIIPQELIIFGILSFLGVAMLITPKRAQNNKYAALLASLCICGFLLTEGWQNGYWGAYGFHFALLPVNTFDNIIFFILGIPGTTHYSADYVPVFPWIFIFWLGFWGWPIVERHCKNYYQAINNEEQSVGVYKSLSFLGRHTLVIYLLHQPLLYFLLKNLVK